MTEKAIRVAGVLFRADPMHPPRETDGFAPFSAPPDETGWRIRRRDVAELPPLPDAPVYRCDDYLVFRSETGFRRVFLDRMHGGLPYAVAEIFPPERMVDIAILADRTDYATEWGNLFFHVGFERILAFERKLILHSSFVRSPLGGILFSGPSGIGKSTQADLWCRFAESDLLNGDRTILAREDGIWTGYGSPYAGSSRCWRNESCPVRAIVTLRQAPDCAIRRLGGGEAFRRLFAETTVQVWDRDFVDTVTDLETDLISEIPVFELFCTPDEKPVRLLWNILEGGV